MEFSNNFSAPARMILVGAALVVLIAGLKSASDIVSPLLMAVFISIVCTPALFWLRRHRFPTIVALIVILGAVGLLGIAVFSLITNSLDQFSHSLPGYKQNLVLMYGQLNEIIARWGYSLPLDGIAEQVNPDALIQFLNYMLSGLSSILADGLVVFFAVLFILAEAATLPHKLRISLKNPAQSMQSLQTFTAKVIRYLVLKAATSLLVAICVAVMLWMFKIDYIFLWAVLAFFLNFIPYIGSVLAGLPAVLLALIDYNVSTALLVATGYVVINIVIGNIIETRLMGNGLNLSSFVVFVSLIFWGWVLGPVGMFLSIPLTMLIAIALENGADSKRIARLMQNSD